MRSSCATALVLCAVAALAEDEEDRERWPLIFAAGEGDAATVSALLAAGVDVHQRSKDGETALHVAAIRGSNETVQALLKAGAEVDARTPTGATIYMTPSMWAVYHGHHHMVRMLLDAGADPHAADENGKTLLEMSQEAAQPAIERMLRDVIQSVPQIQSLPPLRWLLNRAGSAMSDSDDSLTMVAAERTDWFNPPTAVASSPAALSNAPALVFTPQSGRDWQLSARVHVEHSSLFDAAVLFVHRGAADWCKLCFEQSPERQPTIVSVVTRDVSDDANGVGVQGTTVDLRVSRYGGVDAEVFAFHYSVDGGRYWTLHRVFTMRDSLLSVSVGFLAQAPTGPSCTARFSRLAFSYTTLTHPRDGS